MEQTNSTARRIRRACLWAACLLILVLGLAAEARALFWCFGWTWRWRYLPGFALALAALGQARALIHGRDGR